MAITKVIILTNEWFTNQKYRACGIDEYINSGLTVEIWNVNYLIFGKKGVPEFPQDGYMGAIEVINYKKISDFRKRLAMCNPETLIVIYYSTVNLIEEVCKAKKRYVTIEWAPVPASYHLNNLEVWNKGESKESLMQRIKYFFSKRRRIDRILKKNPPEQCFMATPADFFPIYRKLDRNQIKFIHHIDYDTYLLDDRKGDVGEDYILFIDEATGMHPEEKGTSDTYHNSEYISAFRNNMKKLFDELERYYGQRVIVAAHPKSEYKGGEFGEREIIIFKTYELIKKASIVMSMYSTALLYAALFKKKVLFMVDDKFEQVHGCNMDDLNLVNRYWDVKPFNVDRDRLPWNYIWYKPEVYKRLIKDFVNCSNETKTYISAVVDFITKLE